MRKTLLAAATAVVLGTASLGAHADDNTAVGGKMFFDLTSISQKNNGVKTANDGTGFDVKRFYLGIDHKFDDVWSANLTTDFNYVGNDGETNLFVKKAYLQGKFDPLFVVRAGSADMPWIPYAENVYGYRFVENTLIDRLKFGTSADWGVHVLGNNGTFNYQGSVVNGAGYKNPSRGKSMDFEGRVGVQFGDFVAAVGGYSGKLGKDTQTSPATHTANRSDALLAYKTGLFTVGGEWFQAKNWNNVTTVATDKADGYSVFGNVNFNSDWAAFVRYDKAKLSKDLNPSLEDKYWNVGLAYNVRKGVRLAFVYKNDKQQSDTAKLDTKEFGIWGEVAF